MIGAITRLDGAPSKPAIHRTYLQPNGWGKADVTPAKMMLGQSTGGGVVLDTSQGPLMVAEGIETALSVPRLLGKAGTLIAALSTSGMRSLCLPPTTGSIVIAADGDFAGQEAAVQLAGRADSLGWQVEMMTAPEGADWNDVLRGIA